MPLLLFSEISKTFVLLILWGTIWTVDLKKKKKNHLEIEILMTLKMLVDFS